MPNAGRTILLALSFSTLSMHGAVAQRAPDPERAAVQHLITAMGEHIQAGNLAALDSLFPVRGLHILTDTATTHGWPEYRDRHLTPDLERFTNLAFAHTRVEAQVRGPIAWVAFRQEMSGETSTGKIQHNGRATAVLEKRDGRWLIVHLHVSR